MDLYKISNKFGGLVILCVTAAVFAFSGCGGTKGDDEEEEYPDSGIGQYDAAQEQYELRVVWRIGAGTRPCTDFGVENVRIILQDDAGDEIERDTFNCDLGERTIKRLAEGYYTVIIEGIDTEGVVTYRGTNDQIEVPAQDHYLVSLSVIYGEAELVWVFDSGYRCQAAGVEKIHVVFEDANLDFPVDKIFTCSDGLAHLGQVPPGPYRVDVTGLNTEDSILYAGTIEEQEVRLGERVTKIEITLEDE